MMRNRIHIQLLVVVAMFFCAARGWAESLNVFPSELRIDNKSDEQRVVALRSRDDGVTLDVTAQATVRFEPEGLARWDSDLMVRGLTDGDAAMTVTEGSLSVTIPVHVRNAGVIPPVSFANNVEPVIMRSGCNTGACHGSAQGKNGFRLTLFGFDPNVDYVNLTRDLRGRRLNAAEPNESLMLMKPTGEAAHEGGTRFDRNSPLYSVIEKWVEEGAANDTDSAAKLTGIEVLPKYAVLEGEGAQQQLVVMASYSDGTDRDVTDLAIMNSSDDLVLSKGESGRFKAGSRGEVYVMARFGTFAVVSQIIVLPANLALGWPDIQPKNYVDELVWDKLRKLRVPPAELCSDDVFIRRAYLDTVGVLPTVAETQSFLADTAGDKRAKLIDALLQRPEFPEVWAAKWAEVLGVKSSLQLNRKGMFRYNDWLRTCFTQNKPIDEIVRELLTAQGGNFTSPATNYYLVETNPIQVAENVSQVFFGIQIKCAQCHNHPFERWKMDDYYAFSSFFTQIGRKPSSDPREQVIFDQRSGEVNNLRTGSPMKPKFLGGEEPDCSTKDRRAVLAEWLTSKENPWFAKNIANRIWAHFIGMGIVDPVDDVRVSNPPCNPQLLDELAKRLIGSNWDMRQMVRDICNSHTYQQSTLPRDPALLDNRNFSHAVVRRLPAEQLLDAVCQVTESKVKFANLPLGSRAVQVADGASGNYFLDLFGRSPRTTACTCERRGEPTLGQTLHLINGDTMSAAIKDPNGRLSRLLTSGAAPGSILDEVFIAAFCRQPTIEEKTKLESFATGAPDIRLAMEDVAWSVLNSKEFVFNH